MSATTIHFVRHGEVHNPDHLLYERLPGFHLSDRGRRMAEATGRYLAENPQTNTAVAVFSSPLERTRETAGIILDHLNEARAELVVADPNGRRLPPLKLATDDRLIEAGNEFRGRRIGHGSGALWRPENLKLIRNLYKPTWGESYRQIAARMSAFAHEKIDAYAGRQIIVVSHESPIWSFRHLLETGHPEHNMLLRHAALASVTSVTFDCDTHQVMSITYVDPAANVA
ncbi:histidine phosphatase family protein [Bifidobacterium vespertilionis]|uniref:Histidine phosphatase family protein n=1 Tax=Bifidobacterium vespertilionis TaxID=2562524 RepID=A0A5J5DWD6_9BIFI|nr:histidine phosphatase family protein [Bifidobacterium vespertilionis]KAA8820814.1 histidine phosphatase family protein [Bifidobacterium vespertilionis]KAA8821215.1 histidine phosphatase family protein [Bifidobacterium vespertilionis]